LAVYAIGDLQGCYTPLRQLLDRLAFDPQHDQLWFTGDLVNRGPESLQTLRFVHSLGDAAVTVLGNHDLHLLARWHKATKAKRRDSLDPILQAEDGPGLLEWLYHRPFLWEDTHAAPGYTLVHAGIPPAWDLAIARACAREAEQVLRDGDRQAYFNELYGDQPNHWHADLKGPERLRFITNAFTRMRYCDAKGRLLMDYNGPPEDAQKATGPGTPYPAARCSTAASSSATGPPSATAAPRTYFLWTPAAYGAAPSRPYASTTPAKPSPRSPARPNWNPMDSAPYVHPGLRCGLGAWSGYRAFVFQPRPVEGFTRVGLAAWGDVAVADDTLGGQVWVMLQEQIQ